MSIGAPRKAGLILQTVPDTEALEGILNELPAKAVSGGDEVVFHVACMRSGKVARLCSRTERARFSIPIEGNTVHPYYETGYQSLAGSVENEAFCLALARACDLDAAEATIGIAGKRRYLLVKRYDRFTDPQGEIRRLHQEDLCQLTAISSQKYERSSTGRGVSCK